MYIIILYTHISYCRLHNESKYKVLHLYTISQHYNRYPNVVKNLFNFTLFNYTSLSHIYIWCWVWLCAHSCTNRKWGCHGNLSCCCCRRLKQNHYDKDVYNYSLAQEEEDDPLVHAWGHTHEFKCGGGVRNFVFSFSFGAVFRFILKKKNLFSFCRKKRKF